MMRASGHVALEYARKSRWDNAFGMSKSVIALFVLDAVGDMIGTLTSCRLQIDPSSC